MENVFLLNKKRMSDSPMNPIHIYRFRQNFLNMPRGRPKGSRNLSAYERGKVKRIREQLSQKGISDFDRLRDQQVLNTIYVNTDGEIFVKYGQETSGADEKAPRSRASEKILTKLEKDIALLRDVL